MRRLRELGCTIALDDFGTGLSSLAYLRALPVDMLKIDGSFVRDVLKDPRAESMVQAIAQLARSMNLITVAEYVETDEIRLRVAQLGVDYGQGFAIARPVPFADDDPRSADLCLGRETATGRRDRDRFGRRHRSRQSCTSSCWKLASTWPRPTTRRGAWRRSSPATTTPRSTLYQRKLGG